MRQATEVPKGSDEPVEVVDIDGAVVDVVSRAEMRAANLRHRCAYVVVRSAADGGTQVLVHHRAGWKDVWPDRWDLAFGGVCGVGESWADAAHRELAEEVGLSGTLSELGEGTYDSDEVRVQGRVYAIYHDGPFRFDDGEVTEVAWVPVAELDGWLAGRAVCPDTMALVGPHLTP
jgi:isopentenyl-diphosphate delta-isomerase